MVKLKALEMYVTGTSTNEEATKKLTDDYVKWHNYDRLLGGWIIGTRSEKAQGLVISLDTAKKVGEELQQSYAQISQEREFILHQELAYLRKNEDTSIEKHILKFKSFFDSLTALDSPVSEKEKVFSLLIVLGKNMSLLQQ